MKQPTHAQAAAAADLEAAAPKLGGAFKSKLGAAKTRYNTAFNISAEGRSCSSSLIRVPGCALLSLVVCRSLIVCVTRSIPTICFIIWLEPPASAHYLAHHTTCPSACPSASPPAHLLHRSVHTTWLTTYLPIWLPIWFTTCPSACPSGSRGKCSGGRRQEQLSKWK